MSDATAKTDGRRAGDRTRPASPSVRAEPTRAPPRPRRSVHREHAAQLSPTLKVLSAFFTLAALVLTGIAGLGLWLDQAMDEPGPLTETKSFTVKRGEGAREIAHRLAEDGAITSAALFTGYYISRSALTWMGAKPLQLKAGEYELQPQASLREIAEVIGEGKAVLSRITIPEGLTSYQIVERIKADRNLTGEVGALPTEGVLLPDTYKFARGMTRQAFLDLMAAEGRKFLDAAWAERQPGLPLKTPEEALVLASIVEKETGRRDERTRVASVFINRLRAGMRLQSDPTILYGLFGGQVAWGRPIYRNEIQQKTAHNTYAIDGLPPTPICNPGRSAILAVLAPAKTSDLYFVADGQGGHVFTQNLKDHNAAVQNWRKIEKEIRAREASSQTRAVVRTAPAAAVAGQQQVDSAGPGVRAEIAGDEPPSAPTAPGPASPSAGAVAESSQPAAPASASQSTLPGAAVTGLVPKTINATAGAGDVPLPVRKPKR